MSLNIGIQSLCIITCGNMCCSPESQLYAGLHQKLSNQQVKGCGSPPPLLLWDSTGVLHPALRLPTQGGCGPAEAPLGSDWENWGCSTWRREGSREILVTLPLLKGLQESWRVTLDKRLEQHNKG